MRLLILSLILIVPFFTNASTLVKKDTPIHIESDELEVQQAKSRAIFKGHVVAVQGPMTLKSQKMIVYYTKAGGDQSIERIEVFKDVFLERPGETAEGDKGFYDVGKDKLEITGNVILKQGSNTVTGEHFRHIPSKGQSRMLASNTASDAPSTTTTKKGRVKGVFMPNKKAQ